MRRFLLRVFFFFVLLPGLAFWAMTESGPMIETRTQPDGADVQATRSLVHRIRSVTSINAPPGRTLRITEAELQAALKTGGRIVPGLRSSGQIGADVVVLRLSAPLPEPLQGRWINVEAVVPAFEDGFALERVRVGRVSLPPGLAIFLGRVGMNAVLGNAAGDKILDAVSEMAIADDALVFTMDLTREERGDIMASMFGAMRGGNLNLGEPIDAIYVALRNAIDSGRLPEGGSLQPHLVFALNAALDPARGIPAEDRAAVAFMALAKACGSWSFAFTIGDLAGGKPEDLGDWSTSCRQVRIRDRTDSRLHFTTAAALRAASNRGFAVSVGEFKELSDSLGGSGFDFSDLAANNSGIRLADHFSALPEADWPTAIRRLNAVGSFVAPFNDLPPRMSDAEFAARYGEIGSPAYEAQLAVIEDRIDALPIYQ